MGTTSSSQTSQSVGSSILASSLRASAFSGKSLHSQSVGQQLAKLLARGGTKTASIYALKHYTKEQLSQIFEEDQIKKFIQTQAWAIYNDLLSEFAQVCAAFEDLAESANEVIRCNEEYKSCPNDYDAQKQELAEQLKRARYKMETEIDKLDSTAFAELTDRTIKLIRRIYYRAAGFLPIFLEFSTIMDVANNVNNAVSEFAAAFGLAPYGSIHSHIRIGYNLFSWTTASVVTDAVEPLGSVHKNNGFQVPLQIWPLKEEWAAQLMNMVMTNAKRLVKPPSSDLQTTNAMVNGLVESFFDQIRSTLTNERLQKFCNIILDYNTKTYSRYWCNCQHFTEEVMEALNLSLATDDAWLQEHFENVVKNPTQIYLVKMGDEPLSFLEFVQNNPNTVAAHIDYAIASARQYICMVNRFIHKSDDRRKKAEAEMFAKLRGKITDQQLTLEGVLAILETKHADLIWYRFADAPTIQDIAAPLNWSKIMSENSNAITKLLLTAKPACHSNKLATVLLNGVMSAPIPTYNDTYGIDATITSDGNLINLIYIPPKKDECKTVILYSHGNGEDLGNVLPYLHQLSEELGVGVVGYDYTGFGPLADKEPEFQYLYSDIVAAFHYAINKGGKDCEIVLYGRSLGSIPTLTLAQKLNEEKIGNLIGVILESALASAGRFLTQSRELSSISANLSCKAFVMRLEDRINEMTLVNNAHRLREISSPVLLIHGIKDKVLSLEHAKILEHNIKGRKATLYLDGDHNDLEEKFLKEILSAIQKFLS